MSYIKYLQVLTAKAVWNFLFLIVILKLFKDNKERFIKDIGLMTPKRFNIYIKPLSWNTQHKTRLELNAEIIARTKDIQDVWNFHLLIQEGLLWLKVIIYLIWASLTEHVYSVTSGGKQLLFSLSWKKALTETFLHLDFFLFCLQTF